MSYGFEKVGEQKVFLRSAGLHTNAKYLGLSYDATEAYEFFDIELETSNGDYFRERTFGPNKEKVFPKDIYQKGVKVGVETNEQAYERVVQEINNKLFHLALCFVDKADLIEKVSKVRDLKSLVETVKKIIGEPTTTINFLAIWKNSDTKQKSNLIIADRIKWCEAYKEGQAPTIKLNKWQLDNCTVEKYKFNAGVENQSGSAIGDFQDQPAGAVSDLPF